MVYVVNISSTPGQQSVRGEKTAAGASGVLVNWLRCGSRDVKIRTTALAVVLVLLRLAYFRGPSSTIVIATNKPMALLQGDHDLGCQALPDDRPIIFYHVPKTGGGTVRNMFLNLEKTGAISVCQQCVKLPQGTASCMEPNVSRLASTCGHIYAADDNHPLRHTPSYDVIAGHYNLFIEMMWDLPPLPPALSLSSSPSAAWRIIQLRNPIDRMRSLYNFQTGNGVLDTTFEAFVAGYDAYNRDAIWDKFGGFGGSNKEAYMGMTIAIIRACGQHCIARLSEGSLEPEGALELAKANLATHFAVVGITEEMDLFVTMCRRRFHRLRDLGQHAPEDESFNLHETGDDQKNAAEAILTKPQIQQSIRASRALRLESELYTQAVRVMREQWEQLEKCNERIRPDR